MLDECHYGRQFIGNTPIYTTTSVLTEHLGRFHNHPIHDALKTYAVSTLFLRADLSSFLYPRSGLVYKILKINTCKEKGQVLRFICSITAFPMTLNNSHVYL
jgi:hypothetical protein